MVDPPPQNVPALTQLYVYVTDSCNCACIHCWIYAGAATAGGNGGNFLKPDVLEAAIVEAKPLGLQALKWTGGEPTIHPDFPALLVIQKRHGLQGRLETNGMRITAELAAQLADSGVDQVSVSLDGARPETHDSIRGVRGAWDRAVAGFGHLVTRGYRPQIIMSLMRRNVTELEDVLKLAAQMGAGSVKFNIVQPNLRGEEIHAAGEAIPVAELIELNRWVEREVAPRFSFPIYFDVPLAFRSLTRILANGSSTCGIKTILGLLADGSYALCGIGVNVPELVFGRAGYEQLDDVWRNHAVLRRIRESVPDRLEGVCGQCLMKTACLGACIAQNYHDSGDLKADYWFCRDAVAKGLFPTSRLFQDSKGRAK